MKKPRPRLSPEARDLIVNGGGRWEHVELSDGPAAQAMVPGVRGRPAPVTLAPPEAECEEPDPNQIGLFDG